MIEVLLATNTESDSLNSEPSGVLQLSDLPTAHREPSAVSMLLIPFTEGLLSAPQLTEDFDLRTIVVYPPAVLPLRVNFNPGEGYS